MTKEALTLALEALERLDGWLALRYGSGLTPEEKQTVTAIKEALAQPEQEPIAFIDMREWPPIRWRDGMVRADVAAFDGLGLFFAPAKRKPQFKEFIKWAGAQGYDCAQTCNSDTGEWICLNPMTADLWKAWQAAHGIKE